MARGGSVAEKPRVDANTITDDENDAYVQENSDKDEMEPEQPRATRRPFSETTDVIIVIYYSSSFFTHL